MNFSYNSSLYKYPNRDCIKPRSSTTEIATAIETSRHRRSFLNLRELALQMNGAFTCIGDWNKSQPHRERENPHNAPIDTHTGVDNSPGILLTVSHSRGARSLWLVWEEPTARAHAEPVRVWIPSCLYSVLFLFYLGDAPAMTAG